MRVITPMIAVAILLVLGGLGFRLWLLSRMWPATSTEVVTLNEAKRAFLQRLRAEHKFRPDERPPLYYTGAESQADEATATRAVNGVIDEIVSQPDGPLRAKLVAKSIGAGMRRARLLATEDRDRTQDYMLEIWYSLGFKGATGRFAYGSSYKIPPGYAEPLPPGWASPTRPRVIPN